MRRQQLEENYATAMKPVEAKVGEWDFAGAGELAEGIQFEEEELTRRLALRKDELARMAAMKRIIIDRINSADPPLTKADLMIRGVGGDVTGADESAVTATSRSGKEESHPWADLGEKATAKLLQLAVDQESANDWLAGALLAFATGDTSLAERLFDQAAAKGIDISPYLVSLASASFSRAVGLLEEKKFKEGVDALEHIQEKYGATAWFESNKSGFDAALAAAKDGVFQGDAESLYQQAVALFERKELFDLRDVVEQLNKEYAQSLAVRDEEREPSFAEMAKAVAALGTKILVRLNGKGDFTSIQAAIDAAGPNSLIEIQDNGPYNEKLVVKREKPGLTIRGGNRYWPMLSSTDPEEPLVTVLAAQTALERLILVYYTSGAGPNRYVLYTVPSASSRLRCTLVATDGRNALDCDETSHLDAADSILLAGVGGTVTAFRNCLLPGIDAANVRTELHCCTVAGQASVGKNAVFTDCLVRVINNPMRVEFRIENCDVFGQRPPTHQGAVSCFSADPQFLDPANLDYRLAPTSPCKGKASDGGDLGVRYTPEMIEMVQIALELRAQGVIDF